MLYAYKINLSIRILKEVDDPNPTLEELVECCANSANLDIIEVSDPECMGNSAICYDLKGIANDGNIYSYVISPYDVEQIAKAGEVNISPVDPR
jgi:hypothetical protein